MDNLFEKGQALIPILLLALHCQYVLFPHGKCISVAYTISVSFHQYFLTVLWINTGYWYVDKITIHSGRLHHCLEGDYMQRKERKFSTEKPKENVHLSSGFYRFTIFPTLAHQISSAEHQSLFMATCTQSIGCRASAAVETDLKDYRLL